jgi:hypothetical protein
MTNATPGISATTITALLARFIAPLLVCLLAHVLLRALGKQRVALGCANFRLTHRLDAKNQGADSHIDRRRM